MNTYYSSNDSFLFRERFFIGKVPARREALPRRRVKPAVAEEDVNSRALAILDKFGRIRTALTNYLARKDIKSKNRKRVERKLEALNKAQVVLTKALEKAKERGKKVPRRIIRRTMRVIERHITKIPYRRPAQSAYRRHLRALRKRAFAQSSISPQTLVGLFSLLPDGGSSKGYKDHRGESLDRFGGKKAIIKIKDKGGEIFIVRRIGSSLKLTRIAHDTRKVPGKFVITAEGKKIQRNKYIRTREKKELVVRFKIIGGKWAVFDKAGKRIQKASKMHKAPKMHALAGIHDEGLTVAARGKGEEIARGPEIAKAPGKRKREKPVTTATPVPLKLPGKKPERPMVAIGKLPKPPEIKIAGITLTPEQTAKIVAVRIKLRETLAKQEVKTSEIQRDCEVMLRKLPKGTLLTDVNGGVLSSKAFNYLLKYIYGGDARKIEAKLQKMPTAPKVEQPKVKISGLKPKQIAKIVEARTKFIRVLGNPKASPHEIRSGFEVFLSKLPSGIKLLGMKKTLHPKTYDHILRIIYGKNESEIIAKLPISDKERFARIMSKVVVPQKAFKITTGEKLSAFQTRIDEMIIYLKGFTARVARQIISDHKDDPKWREKSPSEKGKKAANLVLGLIRNLEKLSAKLERGKDVPAKELAVAFSIFRPGGKAHREYLAKVLPKVKTPKKPGARVVAAAALPAKKLPTVAKKPTSRLKKEKPNKTI